MTWEQRMGERAHARITEQRDAERERAEMLRVAWFEAEWERAHREGPRHGCSVCLFLVTSPIDNGPMWVHVASEDVPWEIGEDQVCHHPCHGDGGMYAGPIAIG